MYDYSRYDSRYCNRQNVMIELLVVVIGIVLTFKLIFWVIDKLHGE